MLVRWQFWFTTVVALLVAVLAGYDMMLFAQNRATQADLAGRTQYLQQSVPLETLYREMVRALADLSVRNDDHALSDLLSQQGIRLGPSEAASTPAAAPSGTGAKR